MGRDWDYTRDEESFHDTAIGSMHRRVWGCAGTGKADMDRVETETQYETLHLVMADTSVPKDEELVEEAISRITREKLQVNVDLHTITSGTNYSLYLGSSEPVDLIAVSGAAGTIRTHRCTAACSHGCPFGAVWAGGP